MRRALPPAKVSVVCSLQAQRSRGHIQAWLYKGIGSDANAIPEKSAQKIFRAADQILRAGRADAEDEEHKQ